ncbi:ANK3 [Symbiodinium natans]|uniref:ANK3 protein n=1 Tax=Symbiodinium natans TaxID=878477 RepID=A0A812TAT3_9DINO|nr:ANK3 [Symbiodinium natans]
MILHTVQNSMILATYLLELLTSGYGARSALHIACWEGSLSAVQAVANGSKKAVQDWRSSQTRKHQRKGDLTPLHIAAICSHAEVAELLLGYDIDPDINTARSLRSASAAIAGPPELLLHISATSSTDLCEVLMSSRANIAARTADQDTPLHFANCFQQLETIELLLKAGADASAANNFGVVPLHVAVAYAGLERLELREAKATLLLCAYGAKLDARDHHGHTPAAVARMAGLTSLLRISVGLDRKMEILASRKNMP